VRSYSRSPAASRASWVRLVERERGLVAVANRDEPGASSLNLDPVSPSKVGDVLAMSSATAAGSSPRRSSTVARASATPPPAHVPGSNARLRGQPGGSHGSGIASSTTRLIRTSPRPLHLRGWGDLSEWPRFPRSGSSGSVRRGGCPASVRAEDGFVFHSPRGNPLVQGSHHYAWRAVRAAARLTGHPPARAAPLLHHATARARTLALRRLDPAWPRRRGALAMARYGHPSKDAARERLLRAFRFTAPKLVARPVATSPDSCKLQPLFSAPRRPHRRSASS
jgi:hypothetical protein